MAKNGTETTVGKIPQCDLCKAERGAVCDAVADAKTVYGPWAFVCQRHLDSACIGLGVGYGQRLVLAPHKEATTNTYTWTAV